jgi:putative SOS response-associated peptidase YedK
MCSHYQTLKDAELLLKKFGARKKPAANGKYDMWPRYEGVFVRRPVEHDAGDEAVPEREAIVGQWGMIPPGTRPEKLDEANKKSTFNARSETAHQLWTFRNAWAKAQHCIIPADAIFEPDWRPVDQGLSKKSVATRFTRADGAPLGIAGLW